MNELLLEARGIGKRYPGVRALDGVDLRLHGGEIAAVVGENGAGKSTLMKILAGVEAPSAGRIYWRGAEVALRSVRQAAELGIALIHQELNLVDSLSVAANVYLGREPRRWGRIDRRKMRDGTARVLRQIGADFAPEDWVSALSLGRRQMVEIAKALSQEAQVLILDEPTSSLSQREKERLFEILRGLRRRGAGVLYISHALSEVLELADRVVVLRDGRNAGELGAADMSREAIVRLMVGRRLEARERRGAAAATGPAVLEVRDLRLGGRGGRPSSFSVRGGELVGIAGLVGAGRSRLLRSLFGAEAHRGGSVAVAGHPARFRHPRDAVRAGVAFVPEDRKEQGLFLNWAIRDNLGVTAAHLAGAGWRRSRTREEGLARASIAELGIRASGPRQLVAELSGGNQQKVVLAKWLAMRPRLLLLDEPTRGVDVAARHEIHALLELLAGQGLAVLFASSDLEELMQLAGRMLVMQNGSIRGELGRPDFSEEAIMRLATAGEPAEAGGP